MSPPEEEVDALALAADPATCPTTLGQLAGRSLALAVAVAGNPSATPRILRRIAMTWSEARAAVARHPELERSLAAELALAHPEALCENPSIPPRIASRRSLPHKVLGKLLTLASPPRWLLPALAAHPRPKMRALAARYSGAEAALVGQLSRDEDPGVRAAAAAHAALPREELRRLACDPQPDVRAAVADRRDLPAELQRLLAREPAEEMSGWQVRWRLARRATDEEALETLARGEAGSAAAELAANPATPPSALARLAALGSHEISLKVAAHPRAPLPVLLRLLAATETSRSRQKQLQDAVLANPSLSPAHFPQLLSAPTAEMRLSLAECPRTPMAMLRGLAVGDPDARVRAAAAANAQCALADDAGVKLARALARDASPVVRKAAARRISEPALLAELAKDVASQVRLAVASSAQAPPAILAELARDLDVHVRREVAGHLAAPVGCLRELMKEAHGEVWPAAMANPALPIEELLEGVSALPRDPARLLHCSWRLKDLPPDDPLWGRALRQRHPILEEALARSAALPLRWAEELARSPRAETRVALASHAEHGAALLQLCGDAEPRVRAALARRLELPSRRVRPAPLLEPMRQLARSLARDPVDEIRALVATHARDEEVLEILLRDHTRAVQLCALRNPASPPTHLLAALRGGGEDASAAREALVRRGHPRVGRRPPRAL